MFCREIVDKSLVEIGEGPKIRTKIKWARYLALWFADGATFGSECPRQKEVFYAYINTKWCGFWSCVHQMIILFTCVLISKRTKVSFLYSVRISSVVSQRTCHLIIVYSDRKKWIFWFFPISTYFCITFQHRKVLNIFFFCLKYRIFPHAKYCIVRSCRKFA